MIAAVSGALEALVTRREPDEVPSIDPIALRQDAEAWAKECGIGKCHANGPDRDEFPRQGFGYIFQISEIGGKDRRATARYTSHGVRNLWTMDSLVTG